MKKWMFIPLLIVFVLGVLGAIIYHNTFGFGAKKKYENCTKTCEKAIINKSNLPACKIRCEEITGYSPTQEKSEKKTEEAWDVKIIDGDIYKVYSLTKKELLISTTDIKDEMIKSFVFAELSPDRSKMCFVGQSMVPQWLYYSNVDGSEITQIGLGKNCTWSNNSKKVAYNNHTTDVSPVNVLVYDLLLKKTTNYTASVQSADLLRAYEIPVWSSNDDMITSEFSSLTSGTGATGKGVSTIDLESSKINDK